MRVNPVPFIFAPGAIVIGYWLGGTDGVLIGLSAWGAVVGAATYISLRMRKRLPDDEPSTVTENTLSLRHRRS